MSNVNAALKPLEIRPYSPKDRDSVLKFIREFPRLPYGPEHFDSFTGERKTSGSAVLDVWQDGHRVAFAVLIGSEGKGGEMAILGYRWDLSGLKFLEATVPAARKILKSEKLDSLEIVSSLGLKVSPQELQSQGFTAGKVMLTLELRTSDPLPAALSQTGVQITALPNGKIRAEMPESEKILIEAYQKAGFLTARRLTRFSTAVG